MTVLALAGLTVVAVHRAVPAPSWPANAGVIKIEWPEGYSACGHDDLAKGQSSYFVWLNRGKELLVLDLAVPEGR